MAGMKFIGGPLDGDVRPCCEPPATWTTAVLDDGDGSLAVTSFVYKLEAVDTDDEDMFLYKPQEE